MGEIRGRQTQALASLLTGYFRAYISMMKVCTYCNVNYS